MSYKVTTLSNEVIKRVILHVFNKHRHDVPVAKAKDGAEGKTRSNKMKYVDTSRELADHYSLIVEAKWLKARVNDLIELYTDDWFAQDADYDAETMVGQVMSLFAEAKRTSPVVQISKVKTESSTTSTNPSASPQVGRQLQMINGKLDSIANSLRIISNTLSAGSRASVKKSVEALVNTQADDSESGESTKKEKIHSDECMTRTRVI